MTVLAPGKVTVDVRLSPTTSRALRRDARAGPTAPEVDAAGVVLRRPGLRAVRGDHPHARVLPVPHRARPARRSAGEIAEAARPPCWSSWARGRRRRPGSCSTPWPAPEPGSTATSPSTWPRAPCGRRPGGGRGDRHRRPRRGGRLPRAPRRRPRPRRARLVAFLGSTIGNFPPIERARFLGEVARPARPVRPVPAGHRPGQAGRPLVAAYDDAAGVTAAFNRNLLAVLNRELGADFDVDRFEHLAAWDADDRWIEMRLQATEAMTVTCQRSDLTVGVRRRRADAHRDQRQVHRRPGRAELGRAGLQVMGRWTDPAGRLPGHPRPTGVTAPARRRAVRVHGARRRGRAGRRRPVAGGRGGHRGTGRPGGGDVVPSPPGRAADPATGCWRRSPGRWPAEAGRGRPRRRPRRLAGLRPTGACRGGSWSAPWVAPPWRAAGGDDGRGSTPAGRSAAGPPVHPPGAGPRSTAWWPAASGCSTWAAAAGSSPRRLALGADSAVAVDVDPHGAGRHPGQRRPQRRRGALTVSGSPRHGRGAHDLVVANLLLPTQLAWPRRSRRPRAWRHAGRERGARRPAGGGGRRLRPGGLAPVGERRGRLAGPHPAGGR